MTMCNAAAAGSIAEDDGDVLSLGDGSLKAHNSCWLMCRFSVQCALHSLLLCSCPADVAKVVRPGR